MNMEIIKQLAILIVGFALLVKGADLFVDGASGIAKGPTCLWTVPPASLKSLAFRN